MNHNYLPEPLDRELCHKTHLFLQKKIPLNT